MYKLFFPVLIRAPFIVGLINKLIEDLDVLINVKSKPRQGTKVRDVCLYHFYLNYLRLK